MRLRQRRPRLGNDLFHASYPGATLPRCPGRNETMKVLDTFSAPNQDKVTQMRLRIKSIKASVLEVQADLRVSE